MKNMSFFNKINKIYFIGVGGISLSALAILMNDYNFEVSGSDNVKSYITENLKQKNIKVFYKHKASNIKSFKPDLVVYSNAINNDNVELSYAIKNKIQSLNRAEFISKILPYFKNVITISGCHGKTTTTSLIAEIFLKAELNPSIHIGGESVNLKSNYNKGNNNYLILEACEYKKSFLKFKSKLGVILNIEEDHPDCYKNLDEINKTFFDYSNICENLVINANYINNFNQFIKNEDKFLLDNKLNHSNFNNKICFKLNNDYFFAKNIRKLNNGGYSFEVLKNELSFGRFKLNIFGKHNIYNVLASVSVADFFGINLNIIKQAISEFKGIKRRFEKVENATFNAIFDYAHHPTEILNLINEVKSLNMPIICVFQPHTYSRTKKYFNDFLTSFQGVYQTIFYKTYSAREKVIKGAESKDLYLALKEKQTCYYYNSFNKIKKHLKKYAKPTCLVLFVGAGDIYNFKNFI